MQTWIFERCRQKSVRQMIIWAVIGITGAAIVALNTRYIGDFVRGPWLVWVHWYWGIAIALVLAALFVKYGRKAWARMRDPSLHPAAKRVGEWGDPISLSAEIEQESKNLVRHRLGSTALTDKYIMTDAWLTFQVLRLQDLLWAYKRVTKHYTYFIPTGKSFEAVLICYGGSAQFSGKENLVDEALQHAAQKAPWAAFGYSKELETTFNKKTAEFCAAIEERRRQASGTSG